MPNHRSILPNFLLFAWFDTLEFNRLQCSNNKMYDDAVFADRFHNQLTMFVFRVLIGLSRLFHAHIAYETDGAKIIATFCRMSYFFHDLIRLNSIVCHVQRARCTMMLFSVINSDINWLMFEVCVCIDRAISTPWCLYCIWNSYIKNHHLSMAWCGKRSLIQDCSETLVSTVIIDICMGVDNVKTFGHQRNLRYIYIYILWF